MRDSNHSSLRCLLDDDADDARAARRRKFRSLALSVSLQALFITVVVVAPLLATGKLLLHTQPPVIIFRGTPSPYQAVTRPSGAQSSNPSTGRRILNNLVQPIVIPRTVEEPGAAPEVETGGGRSCPGCQETGLIDPPPGMGQPEKTSRPPTPDPKPPAQHARQVVGGIVQQAKQIHHVSPAYPPLCRQMRLEGELVLRAIIAKDGSVQELSYVSGHTCFLQHSMNAVSQWRYRPTLLNGQPVEVETTVRVMFILNR